jgi:hypothetical protein
MNFVKTIACLLLFVISPTLSTAERSSVPGSSPGGSDPFSLILSGQVKGSIGLMKMEPYSLKGSGRLAASFDLGFGRRSILSGFSVAPHFGLLLLSSAATSPGDDLLIYRGFTSFRIHIGASTIFPRITLLRFKPISPGFDISMGANYSRYPDTPIYFFYPDISFMPFAGLSLLNNNRDRLDLGLPLDIFFRRDMEIDFGLGLSLRWNIFLF